MNRKALTLLLFLTLIVSTVGIALAEFDYSVFENNENFEVKIDAFDDTVDISTTDKFNPITVDTSDGKATDTVTMILSVGTERILVVIIKVVGVHNFKNITLLPDKTRYTTDVTSTPSSLYETTSFLVSPDLMPMFDEIIEKQITSVRYRLSGDDNVDSALAINVEQLKLLIDLYKEAGGMNQDFSIFKLLYPVTVK
jgi:hypothetical protein